MKKNVEKKTVAETFLAGHGSPFVAQISIANAPKLYRAILDGLDALPPDRWDVLSLERLAADPEAELGRALGAGLALCIAPLSAQAGWEPTRTVEIIVPAGPGGGADQSPDPSLRHIRARLQHHRDQQPPRLGAFRHPNEGPLLRNAKGRGHDRAQYQ